jgi:hypothetical protein
MTNKKNIYILIGGGGYAGEAGIKLSKEISSWLFTEQKPQITVLFILFGRNKNEWSTTISKYTNLFDSNAKIEISSEDKAVLKNQFFRADVIFIATGSELLLKEKLNNKDLPKKNKIVVASSAGVNVLSTYYYSNDRSKIEKGLAVLPIKTICHFSSGKEGFAFELTKKAKNLPVLKINENEYLSFLY